MLNNYLTVINAIDTFCANHANIHRFKSSFFEQMDDFSTSGNSFPIFYAVPNDIAMEENIDVMSFRIYCLDILQKDRVNEETILNSTYQNLRDLVNWLRNDEYNDLNVLNSPRAIPVNNFLVDFTTGWYIDVELEVSVGTNDCDIPFTQNFQLTGTSCDVSYITPFLTCATVTGCTTLQEYVAQQINANSGASANYYTTGATLVGSTAFFDRNDLLSAYTLDLSSFSGGFSGWTGSSGVNSIVANNGLNSVAGNFAIAGGINNLASGDRSFIGNGNLNSATTQSSSILGGSNNLASGQASAINGGSYNISSGAYSISSGYRNTASGSYSNALGGNSNISNGQNSFIGNGNNNSAITNTYATVVNGRRNIAYGLNSFIGNGGRNLSYGNRSAVINGIDNVSSADFSFVANGTANKATGFRSSIINGFRNSASTYYSVVVGGSGNYASGQRSFIGNGYRNNVSGTLSSVLNGNYNSVTGYFSSVLGGLNNTVTANYSSILGGKRNIVSGAYSSVLAGANITASTSFTAYVPKLNIQTLGTGTSINNLGIDANGFVVSGTTASEFTGGTVSGMTTFSEGISATTYYGLPVPPAVNLFNYYNFS